MCCTQANSCQKTGSFNTQPFLSFLMHLIFLLIGTARMGAHAPHTGAEQRRDAHEQQRQERL